MIHMNIQQDIIIMVWNNNHNNNNFLLKNLVDMIMVVNLRDIIKIKVVMIKKEPVTRVENHILLTTMERDLMSGKENLSTNSVKVGTVVKGVTAEEAKVDFTLPGQRFL